eukprot:2660553-Rhodomonas_salina.1
MVCECCWRERGREVTGGASCGGQAAEEGKGAQESAALQLSVKAQLSQQVSPPSSSLLSFLPLLSVPVRARVHACATQKEQRASIRVTDAPAAVLCAACARARGVAGGAGDAGQGGAVAA